MPPFGPIKRRDLIAYLRELDFDGPFSGKKYQFMSKGALRVRIPFNESNLESLFLYGFYEVLFLASLKLP